MFDLRAVDSKEQLTKLVSILISMGKDEEPRKLDGSGRAPNVDQRITAKVLANENKVLTEADSSV